LYAKFNANNNWRLPIFDGIGPCKAAYPGALYVGIEVEQQLSMMKKRILVRKVTSEGIVP
jgi:hypothetical protein